MTPQGYIKLHRQILEWEWYQDTNVKLLFIHCLLKANYQDKKWQGLMIPRGSFVTSFEILANETGLTTKQIRTALNKLERTGDLASKRTNRFSLVTVVKYSDFQDNDCEEGTQKGTQEGTQRADEGQTEGTQRATTKEIKETKESKESKKEEKINKKEILDLSFIPKDLLPDYEQWLNYRKEIKKPLKPTSIKANYSQLMKLANDNLETAKEIINQSIANGWQGLFEIKTNTKQPKGNYDSFGGYYNNDIPL